MASKGRFVRTYWYEKGVEYCNPKYNSRFRVNAPETSLNPSFMYRSEARENGMMLLPIDEDLARLNRAELYLEIWGGHPGTANKRVTINGRSTYPLPEVGTARNNCTHSYPVIPLKVTDLVNGHNAMQFACDKGDTFWGHFIIDNACLMATLKNDHPELEKAGLTEFEALVKASLSQSEIIDLSCETNNLDKISHVDYFGYYEGYDENGNGKTLDWHGFTKARQPTAILGTTDQAPFNVSWDISMLPEQRAILLLAVIHFKNLSNIAFVSPITYGLCTPERKDGMVKLYVSEDLPKPFWSRANRKSGCTIQLDLDPARVKKAQLNTVVWDGGKGNIENPFMLNGYPLNVAGSGRHDVLYSIIDVPPEFLKKGANEIELLSDTEHHGIEVLLPGPAFMVRSK